MLYILTLAITLLLLVFLPKTTEDPKDIATDFYSPGDSRLLSFSSFFCKGIKLETNLTAIGLEQLLHSSIPLQPWLARIALEYQLGIGIRIHVHAHIKSLCVFFCMHAQNVPHIVYHCLHRKKYTIVMKKVHEQVAKIS